MLIAICYNLMGMAYVVCYMYETGHGGGDTFTIPQDEPCLTRTLRRGSTSRWRWRRQNAEKAEMHRLRLYKKYSRVDFIVMNEDQHCLFYVASRHLAQKLTGNSMPCSLHHDSCYYGCGTPGGMRGPRNRYTLRLSDPELEVSIRKEMDEAIASPDCVYLME